MDGVCGRYANSTGTIDLIGEYATDETVDDDLPPSWNIAPTDPVRAVVQRPPRGATPDNPAVRQLRTVRWGLVPSWSKNRKGAARLINARHETVTEKPAFRSASGRRRCLLPAIGYFEWQKRPGGKVPYFLHAAGPLAFAGLYEVWRDETLPDDDPARLLWTATIITQPATDALGEIHDRCPVIVPADVRAAWLDCSADDPQVARRLLDAMPAAELEPTEVSTAVNSVANDGPELIAPAAAPPASPLF